MCIQNISASDNLDYLNFLNDCEEDKLYPALRFGEDENFMWIDGLDSKKASISKVGFQVIINDQTYTKQADARRELLQLINNVNATKLSGAETLVYVSDVSHLPTRIGDDINLAPLYTYQFTSKVDLKGARLVGGSSTTILGFSSENCSIFSTGLNPSKALIKADSTFVIRYIEINGLGLGLALDMDCTGNRGGNAAFDWTGVNIVDFPQLGTIKNIDNFIFKTGVIGNSANLVFDENFDSIVIVDSLLSGNGSGNIISWPSTAICNRRIRIEDSPIITTGTGNGLNADPSMTIGNEAYILEKVNFTNLGTGDSIVGLDSMSNKSLFTNCKGINNTSAGGSMFAKGNALNTVFPALGTWVKINTVTVLTPDTQKFSHSNNRLTCEAAIQRNYLIIGNCSFSTVNNRTLKIAILHSKSTEPNNIIPMSIVTQDADGNGRAQSVSFQATLSMKQDTLNPDYIEAWALMTNGNNNTVFEDLTISIAESK